jgi:hypothetical protein
LQPLDVGVFGPFQRAWLDWCDSIVELTGSEMPKEDFIKEYMQVREQSFRPSTIMSAFKKSGIWPIDRTVFTEDDFATSIPYSTEARDIPPLPKFDSLPPLDLDPYHDSDNHSASDSDSDSDSDSELQSPHFQPQILHFHPSPMVQIDHSHPSCSEVLPLCYDFLPSLPTPHTFPHSSNLPSLFVHLFSFHYISYY